MPTLFGGISFNQFVRPIINILERLASNDSITQRVLDDYSAKMRVALPARVISFDALKQTVTVQPLIREKIIDPETGSVQWRNLPVLPDVVVIYPHSSIGAVTFPLIPGDEVQLLFNDRCYDSWYTTGQVSNWNDRRFHDLSDAVAIPGGNSLPNVIPAIAPDAIELRSFLGNVRIAVNDAMIRFIIGDVVGVLEAGVFTISSAIINLKGNVLINGEPYNLHQHVGVMNGPDETGPVAT